MKDFILKVGPWLAMVAGIIFGLFRNQQAKAAKAEAAQEVAETKQEVAEHNAAAAQKGADSAKERIDVENNIAVGGDSVERLQDNWSRD